MTALMPVLKIEENGRVIRGLALPFGERALVPGGGGDSYDIVEEVMERESIEHVAERMPLLESHERSRRPAGIIRSTYITDSGLFVEGELIGNEAEIESLRSRFREGLFSQLSVGFTQNNRKAIWERPTRPGQFPVKRPRGVRVEEVSLVNWGAYRSAGVLSLSLRSAADQEAEERRQRSYKEGRQFLHEMRMAEIERQIRKDRR